ncbi:MAG: hypothetical protein EOM67_11600, partial [Spirochaetia bacterium]|nr:hypothetical protein [Spirochaetia bacterium]
MNRSSKVLLMVATIVAIIVNLVSCTATSSKEDTSIMIVAHRGGAALKKENSLEAFENVLLHKIDAIELDVH